MSWCYIGVIDRTLCDGVYPTATVLQALLDDCTFQEQWIVLKVASATKQALRETDGKN